MGYMASPLCAGKNLLLVVTATLILQHSTATDGVGNSRLAKKGCPDKCGNVSIPYPFGIGPGCFFDGFEVNCTQYNVPILNTSGTPLLEINLTSGEAIVQNTCIAHACNVSEFTLDKDSSLQIGRSFMVSTTKNIFTAVGCSTVALIAGDIQTPIMEDQKDNIFYRVSACGLFCVEDGTDIISTDCSGRGCCKATVPRNLKSFYLAFFNFSNDNADQNFTACSTAFIAQVGWFESHSSYVRNQSVDRIRPPLVLDWVVGNATCEAARKMGSSYACADTKSECIDVPIAPGYRCKCSPGYQGNPYIAGGCLDINECDFPSQYPCNGKCKNIDGGYTCSCPPGTESKDPKNASCNPSSKMIIGLAMSVIFIVACIFIVMTKCEKTKLAKEKDRFFKQNGGHILYQQLLSKQVDMVTIFTIEDMKKATDNFNKSRELGTGGHGIVYKGILKNNKVVAIKRSKIIDVTQTDEFVQEIVILSQINHRNVVRLLGCCLEVEVPILVYEFIPNGTLFHLIHVNHDRPPLSLEARLKIAQESAEALAYLHLSTNHPIVHGDVKSLNILLDENYMAKVTDFGASRILPKDTVQLMTMVQGTLGYLDPECLQERKLTEKSDVYSFGVVLLELITRKTAIYFEGHPEEGKNLASSFLRAKKENRVESMLDTNIMDMGLEELFQEVTDLASICLSLKRDERPSMTQVADKLKAIRSTWREILLLKHEETQCLIERPGMDLVCDLSPSMTYTAQMLGLDIETPHVGHAGTTSMFRLVR